MEEEYFYNIDVDYDIEALSKEITNYLNPIYNQSPEYGSFKSGNVYVNKFRYSRIKNDDIYKLPIACSIKDYLEKNLDIKIDKNVPVACTYPFFNTRQPHMDGTENKKYVFSINFPLFKIDYGSTIFFEEIDNASPIVASHLSEKNVPNVNIKNPENLKKVYEIKMDRPKIIRTEKYHAVNNSQNPDFRMNLAFRTHIDDQVLTWAEILEKVKNYNKGNHNDK